MRTFSERDVSDAIELRGTVEGLAGAAGGRARRRRRAAARGAQPAWSEIDGVLRSRRWTTSPSLATSRLNQRFHNLLSEMAGSPVLARELERVMSLPFASPSGFVVVQANSPRARDMLIVAQDQHRQVLDAIERREGSRAEGIMREHSRIAQRNLREAVQAQNLDRMPGVRLIRQR